MRDDLHVMALRVGVAAMQFKSRVIGNHAPLAQAGGGQETVNRPFSGIGMFGHRREDSARNASDIACLKMLGKHCRDDPVLRPAANSSGVLSTTEDRMGAEEGRGYEPGHGGFSISLHYIQHKLYMKYGFYRQENSFQAIPPTVHWLDPVQLWMSHELRNGMPATKSALYCGGITQPTRRHGLRSFFNTRRTVSCDTLSIDIAQLHHSVRQQAQRPLRMPCGRLSTTERDQPRFELAVRLAQVPGTAALPTAKRRFQTLLHEPPLDPVHLAGADAQHFGN